MNSGFEVFDWPLSSGLTRGLTLSPQAGRGDERGAAACPSSEKDEGAAAYPFSPPAGRRCRQADEGQQFLRREAPTNG